MKTTIVFIVFLSPFPPTDSLTCLHTDIFTVETFALDNTHAANQEVGRILETMLRLVGVFFLKLS